MFKLQLLFFCIILLIWSPGEAKFSHIRFEKLDIRDGLSHNRVNSIYQDQLGFMWFATRLGLNRYDGRKIKVIDIDLNDPFAPKTPDIIWMAEGPNGNLWMKTHYGVFAFNVFHERFVDISILLEELQISNNLSDIVKDEVGNYWFVVAEVGIKKYISSTRQVHHYGGAYRGITSIHPDGHGNMALVHLDGEIELVNTRDPRKNKFIRYPDDIKKTPGLSTYIDADGHYWFYSLTSPYGMTFFDPVSKNVRNFDKKALGSNLVTGILQDQSGRIIVGVDHGGLSIIDKENWQIQNYKNNPSDPNSLSHNSIISLYKDQSGWVWVGSHKGGVNYFSQKSLLFNFYRLTENTVANVNDIWPLIEGSNGTIWMGTDGGGLVHFEPKSGEYTNYVNDLNDVNSLSSNIVVSLARAVDGGLWIGTYFGGLNYFDGKNFTRFSYAPNNPNSICDQSVWVLFIDSHQQLWVGTLKGGIDVYDADFNKLNHFDVDNGTINSNYITSICEDKNGLIWIGTGYGLEIYDPETNRFKHIIKEADNPNSINSNSIMAVYCDRQNNMWIGSMHGLNKFDRRTNKFVSFTREDGLPENLIGSIIEDDLGNIWLSGYKGLSKFSFENGEPHFENFDISNGLQGDMFNERSSMRLSNGDLVFGGKNGLNIFNPEKIRMIDELKRLVFTDFFVSNHRVSPGELFNGKQWFIDGFNTSEKIILKSDENSFSIEFTALSFYRQENMYKYRLVGFDDNWTIRSYNQASFTNLDPGEYRFEVMGTDHNQRWSNQPISMEILIMAPLWKTPLAYGLYVFIIIGILLASRRAIIQKGKFRARLEQDRLEARRLHEFDLMKIKFITNISHEFRTPLSLILSPVERLLKTVEDPQLKKYYEVIFRNAKRLLTHVNQLLDFRKMEANQHRLSISVGDIVAFVGETTESFTDLARDRKILLNFNSEIPSFLTYFDHDKIEKILFNLLSNAFKFTHSGGKVEVSIKEASHVGDVHNIQICVKDTGIGIGIPKYRHQDVFRRFFQVDQNNNSNINYGSGIGLSISREFVEMHNGQIRVESEIEKGSSFLVELPLSNLTVQREMADEGQNESFPPMEHLESKPTIVLADDNSDFRFYLKDNLKETYNVYEVPNGRIAWREIVSKLPDVVVTDIMMPELNGVDLCKKIKNDPRTAHIPVVLLSAYHSDDQKLAGYEAGAIEYITKPFNFEILTHSIRSAIRLQKDIYASEKLIKVNASEIQITSMDEQFVQKAIEITEQNISNAEYSVLQLSKDLAVSRGQLYKKIMELTGMSPIEFIRSIRLKRAEAFLEKSQLTVSEIAYKVGFNNPKYFSKYFKKQYGMLPSKFASTKKKCT